MIEENGGSLARAVSDKVTHMIADKPYLSSGDIDIGIARSLNIPIVDHTFLDKCLEDGRIAPKFVYDLTVDSPPRVALRKNSPREVRLGKVHPMASNICKASASNNVYTMSELLRGNKPHDFSEGDIYLVSGSGLKPYELMLKNGVYSCSCPGWFVLFCTSSYLYYK